MPNNKRLREAPPKKKMLIFTVVCLLGISQALDFGIAVIPDTQYYSGWHPETFEEQCYWICSCAKKNQILFTAHLGDLVHNGNNETHQWKVARSAIFRLESCNMPHSVLPGNHDIDQLNPDPYKLFDHTFSIERYEHKPWFGGEFPSHTLHNSFQILEKGKEKFIFLNIEYLPYQHGENYTSLITWANDVLTNYSDHTAFITTHYAGNGCEDFVYPPIFNMIFNHCNVLAVFGGHVIGCSGERIIPVINKCGHLRSVLISNFQNRKKGGNGWLRYYRFRGFSHLDSDFVGELCALTYSPQLGKFEKDTNSFFSIDLANGVRNKGCQLLASEICDAPFVSEGFVLGTLWIASLNLLGLMFLFGIPLSHKEWVTLLDHQIPRKKIT